MLEQAREYFATFGEPIFHVWYEPKQDTYCCRTVSAEYWQITSANLAKETKRLENEKIK